MVGIAEKLHVNLEKGLNPLDLDERVNVFGSNSKAPPTRTPFCTLFFGCLEDFMLRLLLVCAVVSIGFDMGFASNSELKTGMF